MKNRIIKLTAAIIIVLVLVSATTITAFAAAKATISVSKTKVNIGDTISVTVTINAGQSMYSAQGTFVFDSNKLKLNSNYASFYDSILGETSYSKTVTFTAIAEGSALIQVSDCKYSPTNKDADVVTVTNINTVNVNISNQNSSSSSTASLSSNCDLSSITVGGGKLTPAFSSSVTSYTVTVPNSVTDGTLSWKLKDSTAKAAVSGNRTLEVGTTIRKITVTAANGTQKVYTVKFIRLDEQGNTVSETSSEPEIPTTSETVIVIDGKNYFITQDFSNVEIPEGFTLTTVTYNDTECPAYSDTTGKHYFVNLTTEDKSTSDFYEYKNGTFKKIAYVSFAGVGFIINELPADFKLPSGYEETTEYFSKSSAIGVKKTDNSRYVIFYAEGPSGEIGYYRYDKTEATMQKYDDFIDVLNNSVVTTDKKETITDKLLLLGKTNLTVLIACALAVLVFIAIIVLVILLIIQKKKEKVRVDEDFEDDTEFEISEDSPKDLQQMIDETFADEIDE